MQTVEPIILPEGLPSFFVAPLPTTGETPTAQTPARRHRASPAWIALGISVLLGVVVGVGYWRIYPKQLRFAPEIAAPLKTRPTLTSTVIAIVPPRPSPRFVIGMPQLAAIRPADEPAAPPVADPPIDPSIAAPAAEAPAPVPANPIRRVVAAANPDATPSDVFVVRFDSKRPGLTPSGLRALNAALRATNKGEKVLIEIDGCAAHYSLPTGIDCAVLTRSLKSILVHRGVEHPADLIASPYSPTIVFPW